MVKKPKSTLVKIDSHLYDTIKAYVEQNNLEYPSIKYFIEKAVMGFVGFKKYDIGGIDYKYIDEAPLKRVVGTPNKKFFMCIACDHAFLKDKNDNGESSKICPRCKGAILHFAEKLKGEEK